jgi:GntR family transcriptional repressor for pyruvate dehydrogenase complex
MVVTRVARQSVADQLFDQLLDGILTGELPAESHLPPERELSTQAGVNRQAVREALQRLRQMDLVEIVHGGGVRVLDWRSSAGLALLPVLLVREGRTIDPAVARSIMELRATIGADAARWCAERSPSGTADALRALVDEMDAIGSDPERWGSIGFDFWEAVVVGADNIAYRLAFNTLRAVAAAVAPHLPGVLGAEWALREGYRAVADAIAAGDGDAAEAAGRQLLQIGVVAVNAFLGSGATVVPNE